MSSLNFKDLDSATRRFMLSEFEQDGAEASEYYGKRLSQIGRRDFPDLMRIAMTFGNDQTLADELRRSGRLVTREMSHRKGVPYEKDVPSNASDLLAQGEVNRYYIRALCLRAIAKGQGIVTVYRARYSSDPRPESERMIGKGLDAIELLEDLRKNIGAETRFGVPGVGGGLSVHL